MHNYEAIHKCYTVVHLALTFLQWQLHKARSRGEPLTSLADVIQLFQYYSDELNAYGDPVELKIRNTNLQAMEIKGQISKYASWRLKQFRKQVEASGASLIIGLPWTLATEDDKLVPNVQEVVEELTKIAPLLYEPDSLNLKTDRTLFGDSVYHLGYKGRKLRSLELSQQLKPLLAAQKNRKGTEIISTNQSQTSFPLEKYPQ